MFNEDEIYEFVDEPVVDEVDEPVVDEPKDKTKTNAVRLDSGRIVFE